MKFGFRTPSFNRSLSAMTKGAAKRALMREIVPYYGKRGMGWSNPKKAAYNHLYSMTTVSTVDLLTNTSNRRTSAAKSQLSEAEYQAKLSALEIRQIGLKQCDTPMALFKMIENEGDTERPMHQAIRQMHAFVLTYMRKPNNCGYDYCSFCTRRLQSKQGMTAKAKNICMNIIGYINEGLPSDDVYAVLTHRKTLKECRNNAPDVGEIADCSHSANISKPVKTSKTDVFKVVIMVIGGIAGVFLLGWIIAEFVFPAILFGLIFLSFLFAKK